jgi:hypothetical protein
MAKKAARKTSSRVRAAGKSGAWRRINRVQLAALLGVHADTITDFARDGMPVLVAGGRGKESAYDAVDCLEWWRARQGRDALTAAKTKSTENDAVLKALKIAREEGSLLPREDVVRQGQAVQKGLATQVRALPRRARHAGIVRVGRCQTAAAGDERRAAPSGAPMRRRICAASWTRSTSPASEKIACDEGAQVGGSEALHNILGYFIEHDPCPMLFVHPTAHVAEEWSKERLADMIRSTPAARAVVARSGGRGSNEAESTLSLKMFPGGFLALGGANTPNTFARRSVRVAIGDDVDRFPAVVGEEGDPADLLVNRTTTFYDALDDLRLDADAEGRPHRHAVRAQRPAPVLRACPECGHEDWITWNDPRTSASRSTIATRDGAARVPSKGHGGCGARSPMADADMVAAASGGRRRPRRSPGSSASICRRCSRRSATSRCRVLVEKWLSAREGKGEPARVHQHVARRGWEDRGARMEPHALISGARTTATASRCRAGAVAHRRRRRPGRPVRAAGDGLGPGANAGSSTGARSPGPEESRGDARALLEALRRYAHASGHQLPIHATCIDTGFATDEMYDFVLAHQVRAGSSRRRASAGRSGEPIVGKPSEKRTAIGAAGPSVPDQRRRREGRRHAA